MWSVLSRKSSPAELNSPLEEMTVTGTVLKGLKVTESLQAKHLDVIRPAYCMYHMFFLGNFSYFLNSVVFISIATDLKSLPLP